VKTNGHNELFSFTDTINEAAPTLVSPANKFSNKVNNVTGRANEVSFIWEGLSTADVYTLYIAYDSAFDESVTTITVEDDVSTVVQSVGPNRSGTALVNFMPGTTYYWRVKASAPLYSQKSETREFTIEPGAALVPSVLAPENGKEGVSATPSFSWSPVSGASSYRFVLANNVNLLAPIVDVTTVNTGYAVKIPLELGASYFWAVKSVAPVEGGWSAIANFVVKEEAKEAAPPIVIKEMPAPIINIPPAPAPPPAIVIPPAPPPPAQIAPAYIWAIIIIGAILVIAVIVLIVRTRRTV